VSLSFPRLLLYIFDLPEEKVLLCRKSATTRRLCSMCDVSAELVCEPGALDAADRDVFKMLKRHVQATTLRRSQSNVSRRLML